MVFQVAGVDEDVIQVDNNPAFGNLLFKDLIHHGLEGGAGELVSPTVAPQLH
jgi:hypothetical protein